MGNFYNETYHQSSYNTSHGVWRGFVLCSALLWLTISHRPLARYIKLWVAHAPGTFTPPPRVNDPDMHHGTWVKHVSWCMSGSLTNGFLWSRWWGKRSRHSRRIPNPQFCVSGKKPIVPIFFTVTSFAMRKSRDKPHKFTTNWRGNHDKTT